MRKSPFVTLIFRGSRFGEAAMPLEALPELAAYRDLILAVAKALYQGAHRDRQRLPKGFETAFRLVLDRVDPGSAVPVVSRLSEDPGLLFPPEPDWFDRARDVVEQGIGAASKGAALPAELSNEILARFGAFGRTLRDDESIVVAQPGKREGAVYDRALRRDLVLRAQATYEDDVDLLGEVRAAKDAEGFALRTADGRKLDVHTPPPLLSSRAPFAWRIGARSRSRVGHVQRRGRAREGVDGDGREPRRGGRRADASRLPDPGRGPSRVSRRSPRRLV